MTATPTDEDRRRRRQRRRSATGMHKQASEGELTWERSTTAQSYSRSRSSNCLGFDDHSSDHHYNQEGNNTNNTNNNRRRLKREKSRDKMTTSHHNNSNNSNSDLSAFSLNSSSNHNNHNHNNNNKSPSRTRKTTREKPRDKLRPSSPRREKSKSPTRLHRRGGVGRRGSSRKLELSSSSLQSSSSLFDADVEVQWQRTTTSTSSTNSPKALKPSTKDTASRRSRDTTTSDEQPRRRRTSVGPRPRRRQSTGNRPPSPPQLAVATSEPVPRRRRGSVGGRRASLGDTAADPDNNTATTTTANGSAAPRRRLERRGSVGGRLRRASNAREPTETAASTNTSTTEPPVVRRRVERRGSVGGPRQRSGIRRNLSTGRLLANRLDGADDADQRPRLRRNHSGDGGLEDMRGMMMMSSSGSSNYDDEGDLHLFGGKKAPKQRPPHRTILAGATLQVRLLRGKDMLHPDAAGLNPYAEWVVFESGAWKSFGQTATVHKTKGSPMWNESLTIPLGCDAARGLLRSGERLELRIWNSSTNVLVEPEFYGSASLPVLNARQEQWYRIAKRSPNDSHLQSMQAQSCGQVQVRVQFDAHELFDLAVGDALTLPETDVTIGLAWKSGGSNNGRSSLTVKSSCIALDEKGEVLLDQSVFPGHPTNHNQSLQWEEIKPSTKLTYYHFDNHAFVMQTDQIPSFVHVWYVLVHLHRDSSSDESSSATPTFDQLQTFEARCLQTSTKVAWCRFRPLILEAQSGCILLRLARDKTAHNRVVVTPVDRYTDVPDFGCLLPHLKQLSEPLLPHVGCINLQERLAPLQVQRSIRLLDYALSGRLALNISLRQSNGEQSLDAVAVLLDEHYRHHGAIWSQDPGGEHAAVQYGRHFDNDGEPDPEMEGVLDRDMAQMKNNILYHDTQNATGHWFDVHIRNIPTWVTYVCFSISPLVHPETGQELLTAAAVHCYDPLSGLEVASSPPTAVSKGKNASTTTTSLLLAYMMKTESGQWKMELVRQTARGTTVPQITIEWATYLQHHATNEIDVIAPNFPARIGMYPPDLEVMELEEKLIPEETLHRYL